MLSKNVGWLLDDGGLNIDLSQSSSPHPQAIHGDERIRTADLLLARQALSHLSYAPRFSHQSPVITCRLSTADGPLSWAYLDLNQGPHAYQACALNQLSYRPAVRLPIPIP
jgi:hypothetical protein